MSYVWRVVTLRNVAICLAVLTSSAKAEPLKGTYSLRVVGDSYMTVGEKRLKSCGRSTEVVLKSLERLDISYFGGVVVNNEDWILGVDADDPTLGPHKVAYRRQRKSSHVVVHLDFTQEKDRARGRLVVGIVRDGELTCADARVFAGTYKAPSKGT